VQRLPLALGVDRQLLLGLVQLEHFDEACIRRLTRVRQGDRP
jgi:hypothetical protein